MSTFLSYSQILKNRDQFRKSGTNSGSDFNLTDQPGLKFFKIFFYFDNGDVDGRTGITSTGLLAPTWNYNIKEEDWYKYTSAWTYLKMNYEDERADQLVQFVNLLSNINSESPWYFMEVNGIDAALERKQASEHDFKFDDANKKISIKCLPDAFDDRIATLLDLYRSITWSWIHKRQVLPSNLRKFDMGILIYEDINTPFHYTENLLSKDYSNIGNGGSGYKSSYKYIEFHNCEIDYNSSKGNYSAISNATGLSPEYTIDITYDDCYESRYNEFLAAELGDFVMWDWDILYGLYEPEDDYDYGEGYNEDFGMAEDFGMYTNTKKVDPKLNYFNKGFLENAVSQVVGTGVNAAAHYLKRAVLGNLYTFSLTKMASQLKGAASGNVWSTARAVIEYQNDAKQRKNGGVQQAGQIGNILHDDTLSGQTKYVNKIGNMFRAQTLQSNI